MTLVVLALLTVVVGWFAFQHIPAWYAPVYVPQDQYQRIRDNLLDTEDTFARQLMIAEPFTFTLRDRDLNEWVAARHAIWRPALEWIPPEIQNPMVRFRPGVFILAGLLHHKNAKVIASLHFSARILDNNIHLKLERVQGGSLPLPAGWLIDSALDYWKTRSVAQLEQQFADRSLGKGEIVQRIAALPDGADFPNILTWPNGKRDFLIEDITFGPGTCTLRIRPYAPGYSTR